MTSCVHFIEYYTRSVNAGLQLLQARTTVVAQLLHNADLAPSHDVINIMIIIAMQVMPLPPAPEPPQPRRRYSCAVMSAQPAEYFPPSESKSEEDNSNSQNEEEEAEDSQQIVPEYEENALDSSSYQRARKIGTRLRTAPWQRARSETLTIRASQPETRSPLRSLQSSSRK
jgi:hypothetical protein